MVMYKTRHCKENYQWMFTVGQWENAWSLWADIKALREKEREREERERERDWNNNDNRLTWILLIIYLSSFI
jgi:head-tail adaptor